MLTTKITFALADWIREWRKCRDKNPSIDECVKFVQWKLEDYKLSDSDKSKGSLKIILQVKKKVNQYIYGFTENIKRSSL